MYNYILLFKAIQEHHSHKLQSIITIKENQVILINQMHQFSNTKNKTTLTKLFYIYAYVHTTKLLLS